MEFEEAHQAILDLEEELSREATNVERAQKIITDLKVRHLLSCPTHPRRPAD